MSRIKLGRHYTEEMHGIIGMAVSRTEHVTGCERVKLSLMDPVKHREIGYVFDETRLRLLPDTKSRPVVKHKPVKSKIKLRGRYRDLATGIEGFCVSKTIFLGEEQVLVNLEYLDGEGKLQDHFVSESRLEEVKKPKPKPAKGKDRNGPTTDPMTAGTRAGNGRLTTDTGIFLAARTPLG